eukprot:CAMPEP_0119125216 /NCGR_PEP_ID=MMETSP1310-20130426/4572_1 /TAXON_ID=464262 /ORGANISM="Genus nov. species nov., Strain RCC2339" /LENGTH=247 /DNA_ID=CAMNT_0007115263 /DNA_START=135 /DNA_END=875 /DNA_ORIENTATION=-
MRQRVGDVLDWFGNILLWLFFGIRTSLFRIHKLAFGKPVPGRTSSSFHKVLLVGDSAAEGYGEAPALLFRSRGLVGRLDVLTRACPRIRQKWQFLDAADHTVSTMKLRKNTLWKAIQQDEDYSDAEVVILYFGDRSSQLEAANSPDAYVREIEAVALELLELEKKVCICMVPTGGVSCSETLAKLRVANRGLVDMAARICSEMKCSGLKVGPDPDGGRLRGKELFTLDDIHFCAKGYDIFAIELLRE